VASNPKSPRSGRFDEHVDVFKRSGLRPVSAPETDRAVIVADGLRALCPGAAVSVLKLTADRPEAA
jgi:hypothetical protein